jgi:hypothetical protein
MFNWNITLLCLTDPSKNIYFIDIVLAIKAYSSLNFILIDCIHIIPLHLLYIENPELISSSVLLQITIALSVH